MKTVLAAAYICLAALPLGSCGKTAAPNTSRANQLAPSSPSRPMRVVSLDFCADQYVLKLVERGHILALSPDAGAPFSYLKDEAKGLPTVRSTAEDVMILKPDLVVRSYGGGPNAEHFFTRAGIPVLNIGWASNLEDIKRVTLEVATGLGAQDKGQSLTAEIDKRLAAIAQGLQKRKAQDINILYMTPSGTTAGSGLIQDMIEQAGLKNFETQPGWRSLPLERLAYEQPDMVAAAFFDTNSLEKDRWSAMRHPLARAQIQSRPTVALNGSWMSCGAWFALDAVEALANGVAISKASGSIH